MTWVSTQDQTEITDEVALTGMTTLFIELCAQMDADPYDVIEAYFQDVGTIHAKDAGGDMT